MNIPTLSDYALPSPMELPTNKVNWTIDVEQCALLIHDMQDYFLHFWPADSILVKQVIANITQLKARCQQRAIPVFYTAQPAQQSATERGLLGEMWGAGLTQAPQQQQITAALAPTPQDIVLKKWRYSAFQRSNFQQQLQDLNRNQLIICGVYAHIGCLTTANDAFMHDIKPFFVADGLADFDRENHLLALRYGARCCAKVTYTKEILDHLSPRLPWTMTQLRHFLQPYLEEEAAEMTDEENLLDYGLDSARIMFCLSQWQTKEKPLDFIAFAKNPTLSHWLTLLNEPTN